MRSRSLAHVLAALAVAATVAAGCGAPEDETLLRFLGFQAAGDSGTGSVSAIEGDARDGEALKVDASFENQSLILGTGGGTGITIYRVDVDFVMPNLDPPSFSNAVNVYAPPAAAGSKDATGGGTVVLSDIPIVPVFVKQWLVSHNASGGDGFIEMTAHVDFLARTDAGDELRVSAALAVTLTDSDIDDSDDGTTKPVVRIGVDETIAIEGSTTDGIFRVYKNGSTASTLTVNYAVSGTATNGTDYTTLTGKVEISSSSPSDTIVVDALADANNAEGETVIVTLMPGAGYTIGSPSSAEIIIEDP